MGIDIAPNTQLEWCFPGREQPFVEQLRHILDSTSYNTQCLDSYTMPNYTGRTKQESDSPFVSAQQRRVVVIVQCTRIRVPQRLPWPWWMFRLSHYNFQSNKLVGLVGYNQRLYMR